MSKIITEEEKYRQSPAICLNIETIKQSLPSMSDMDLSVLYGAFQSAHDGFLLWLNKPCSVGKSGDLIWHLIEDMDRAKTEIAKEAASRTIDDENRKALTDILIKYDLDCGFPNEVIAETALSNSTSENNTHEL